MIYFCIKESFLKMIISCTMKNNTCIEIKISLNKKKNKISFKVTASGSVFFLAKRNSHDICA